MVDERRREFIVVGAGIGGLTAALSLHEAGYAVSVFESVDEIRPLGVGINLLPHAVRELDALGLADRLIDHGFAPTHLSYFTKRGELIWSEERGLRAGYRWPQVSIHRGVLQRILRDAVAERIGEDKLHTGHHLVRVVQSADTVSAWFTDRRTGSVTGPVEGGALVGADGIHSAVRKDFYPSEGMPKWNGALLWRGTAEWRPIFDATTMIWAGHVRQKFVCYPIARPDPVTGRQLLNFIAELRGDETELIEREDWNKPGVLTDFLPRFEGWRFDWLDVPALITASPGTFVFPMVDRDPVDRWSFGRVTLLGDAAHPMYPIGSNGASQAILDARALAGCLRSYPGDPVLALARYDEVRRPPTSGIVLANRGMGPELPMHLVEQRAPDGFKDLADVISPEEILEATDGYRRAAGFALAELNERPSLADVVY